MNGAAGITVKPWESCSTGTRITALPLFQEIYKSIVRFYLIAFDGCWNISWDIQMLMWQLPSSA